MPPLTGDRGAVCTDAADVGSLPDLALNTLLDTSACRPSEFGSNCLLGDFVGLPCDEEEPFIAVDERPRLPPPDSGLKVPREREDLEGDQPAEEAPKISAVLISDERK